MIASFLVIMAAMLNTISGSCQTILAPCLATVYRMETFKERMKRIRLRAGYKSQGLAAKAIGCERGTVGMWEAPSSNVMSVSDKLFEVARAYKVRPEWINDLSSDDDGYPWEPGAKQSGDSQPLRLDVDTIVSTTKALLVFMRRRDPSATLNLADRTDAELFASAYALAISGAEDIEFAASVADLIEAREKRNGRKGGEDRSVAGGEARKAVSG